jgi:hypothetical protein
MTKSEVLAMIAAGGVPYDQVRDQITAGDFMFLHDEFDLGNPWYSAQIAAVQAFTGPFAHVAVIDKFANRVWVEESVEPYVRVSLLSTVIGQGFFWLPLGIEMTEAERDVALKYASQGAYSKPGAIAAGARWIERTREDADESRWWCAKYAAIVRRPSVDCGPVYVPTAMCQYLVARYGVRPIYVRMK